MSSPTRANATPSHLKFTCEDYLSFPDDGKRHEIIDGDHFMTPVPLTRHQVISAHLHAALYAVAHRLGVLLAAPTDVVLSRHDVVQPDLLYISAARQHIMQRANIQGAPDLVVEIISDETRRTDEIVKRSLYERRGVQEYWIIDPEVETAKIFRLHEGKYQRMELSREAGDELSTPMLPGFHLSLEELFTL